MIADLYGNSMYNYCTLLVVKTMWENDLHKCLQNLRVITKVHIESATHIQMTVDISNKLTTYLPAN